MKKIITGFCLILILTSCFGKNIEEKVDNNKNISINTNTGQVQQIGLGGEGYSGSISSSSQTGIGEDLYGEKGELVESGALTVPVGNYPNENI